MGPLSGLKIIELSGIGPGPFTGMLLADMGAEVISIHRKSASNPNEQAAAVNISERGKRSIALNLKSAEGIETVLKLVESADALFEGFRPGVTERLGIGPDECLARNPKLVYGRMTGWGQDGPMAHAAGHDINYISLSGALHAIGRKGEKPQAPINLVGDFGGGGMFLAFGMACAIIEAQRSGKGQVVDVSMVEGSATLMHMMYSMKAMGAWTDNRGTNLLDTGAHFYDTYETKDGKYVSIGSIEPQFYALLVEKAELDKDKFAAQMDPSQWDSLRDELTQVFKQKTRDEWCEIMEGTDVCFAPVLAMAEVQDHAHNQARQSFVEISGVTQPAPAPKFSRSSPETPKPPKPSGIDTLKVLKDFGFSDAEVDTLKNNGAIS
jgi:alpha-methylacyl-CoA racemase